MASFTILQHCLSKKVAGTPLDMILGGLEAGFDVVGRKISLPLFGIEPRSSAESRIATGCMLRTL
jgi:hypothetical protein